VYGHEKIPPGLQLVGDDAHELASEVVMHSIEAFRTKTLMHPNPAKRWHPGVGASLRTFFIGRSLMELPDVYVPWERRRQRDRRQLAYGADQWEQATSRLSSARDTEPHHKAVAAVTLERLDVDRVALAMLQLQEDGYSYEEIAQMFIDAGIDASARSVASRIHRLKQKARKQTEVTDGKRE
jgi:hypothetical protein